MERVLSLHIVKSHKSSPLFPDLHFIINLHGVIFLPQGHNLYNAMAIPSLALAAIVLPPFRHILSHRICATYALARGVSAKMKVVLCFFLLDVSSSEKAFCFAG